MSIILIVGESWGANEQDHGHAFVGASGRELAKMLSQSKLLPELDDNDIPFSYRDMKAFWAQFPYVRLTNVVSARPSGNDMKNFFLTTKEAKEQGATPLRGLFPKPIVLDGLAALNTTIDFVQPDIIIAFGSYTLWALTEDFFDIGDKDGYKIPTGIVARRGSMIYTNGIKLLPTIHPAAILRKWDYRPSVIHDLRRAQTYIKAEKWPDPEWDFILNPSFDQAMDHLTWLRVMGSIKLACDIETQNGVIICMSIASTPRRAISIPFFKADTSCYWPIEEHIQIAKALRELLTSPHVSITWQNGQFDLQYLQRYLFITARHDDDTMTAQHVLWPGTPKDLAYISSLYCEHHRYWKKDGKVADGRRNDEAEWAYNCEDACRTFEAMEVMRELLESEGLTAQYEFQMKLKRSVFKMSIRGIRVDEKTRAEQAIQVGQLAQAREKFFETVLPEDEWPKKTKNAKPWYRSPKQLAELFYDEMGLPVQKSRSTGNTTTNDNALKKLRLKHPALRGLFDKLIEYRSLKVFHDTALGAKVDPDKRMRCEWRTDGPETFRFASGKSVFGTGGNLQNLPSGTEEEK